MNIASFRAVTYGATCSNANTFVGGMATRYYTSMWLYVNNPTLIDNGLGSYIDFFLPSTFATDITVQIASSTPVANCGTSPMSQNTSFEIINNNTLRVFIPPGFSFGQVYISSPTSIFTTTSITVYTSDVVVTSSPVLPPPNEGLSQVTSPLAQETATSIFETTTALPPLIILLIVLCFGVLLFRRLINGSGKGKVKV